MTIRNQLSSVQSSAPSVAQNSLNESTAIATQAQAHDTESESELSKAKTALFEAESNLASANEDWWATRREAKDFDFLYKRMPEDKPGFSKLKSKYKAESEKLFGKVDEINIEYAERKRIHADADKCYRLALADERKSASSGATAVSPNSLACQARLH